MDYVGKATLPTEVHLTQSSDVQLSSALYVSVQYVKTG